MLAHAAILLVTLLAAMQATGTDAKHNIGDAIKYPGPIQETLETQTRYGISNEIPDECKNQNYCLVKPSDYPQAKYDNLIKNKIVKVYEHEVRGKRSVEPQENSTKSTDDIKIPITQPDTEVSDIIDKQGDPDEVDNCETQVEFEPLFKVKSRVGDWRTVVQSPSKNFVQSVRLETCRERDTPCFTVLPKIPTYTTFCKQKFTTWHIVVDAEGSDGETKTEKIPVDLPTCCSCHYKSNF